MTEPLHQSRRPGVRAAMFVDFDNVYTGLLALDPAAAKRFAEDPKHWTEALADGGAGEDSRRFLIRNCYLNPVVYSKYRTYWTRAGFRVIDCPSLTQRHNAGADSYGRVPETAARPGHSEVENHGSLTSGP
ncbi:MAG TPA: hypothetical protein VLR70_06800 [Arthrobacter sp.]|nr:hypothetical protein [Arthrobacter sp.]